MSRLRLAFRFALSDGVPRRAFYTACVVGSLLNFINQGDVLIAGHAPNWHKLLLTFMVPYCVNTLGAVTAKLAQVRT